MKEIKVIQINLTKSRSHLLPEFGLSSSLIDVVVLFCFCQWFLISSYQRIPISTSNENRQLTAQSSNPMLLQIFSTIYSILLALLVSVFKQTLIRGIQKCFDSKVPPKKMRTVQSDNHRKGHLSFGHFEKAVDDALVKITRKQL